MLDHLEFNENGFRFSLTGTVLTVYDMDGFKVRQYFYDTKEEARALFLAIA